MAPVDEEAPLLHDKVLFQAPLLHDKTGEEFHHRPNHAIRKILISTVFLAATSGTIYGASKGHSVGKFVSQLASSTSLDASSSGFHPTGKVSDWQMYKVTLSVIPGTGEGIAEFFTEYVAPAVVDLPTDLGCSSKRYAVTLLNQDLHWVDAKELEREGHGTTFWNEYFKEINGDMQTFNAFMHNKVMLYVPSLTAHEEKFQAGKQINIMRRLSTDSDGEVVAHLGMNVQGRLYELVGPANDLDTSEFKYWDADTECAGVQGIPESLKSMKEKYLQLKEYHDSTSVDDEVANFDLPVPMLVHHSIATDDFSKQNDWDHLKKFTGALIGDTVTHSATCQSTTLSWDYESEGGDVFKLPSLTYVINTSPTHARTKHTVTDYLDYLWDSQHVKFAGDYKKHWGDNWDHWLDYHIGMQVTNFATDTVGGTGGEAWSYHDLIYNTLHEGSWPVGYRHGLQSGESGDDYHFYTGYRNTYAWEWLINEGAPKGHVYDLCGCLPENNAKIYFEKVGRELEESQCGWFEGDKGYDDDGSTGGR